MITRIIRSADPFARVPRVTLNDPRLTWKAKGILSYLLSKPNDWTVRRRDILAHGKGGDEAIREGFKELEAAGYAKLVTTQAGREWHITDVANPLVAKTATSENPDEGFPVLSKNEISKKEKKTPKPPSGALLFPIWQKRLAAIFNRRPTRNWDPDELKAFDALVPIDDTELATVERYYAANRKREGNICRTSLLTLLRHWSGEVDRAEKWERDRGAKARRFERKPTTTAKPGDLATPEDFKRAGPEARRQIEELRARLYPTTGTGDSKGNGQPV